ncbi:MAG: transposase [Pirellulaceae bacterium]|nr:transposase [Pirellulaceae bacterium]
MEMKPCEFSASIFENHQRLHDTQRSKTHTPELKAAAVRRHWCDKVPVSELAVEPGVPPSQIHNWINQAKQQLDKLFDRPSGRPAAKEVDSKDKQIAALQAKLVQKHEVISELKEEKVKAKKANGDL